MSRFKRYAHSIVSGYVALWANIAYTFASVPLALHYLSAREFGLWAVVTQVVGYLLLLDLGMTGSITRILVEHKDAPESTDYRSVVGTGRFVLVAQGATIAILAAVLGGLLPGFLAIPDDLAQIFGWLVAGHGFITGAFFWTRMESSLLQAHQRHDVLNYAQVASFALSLMMLWLGLHLGWGMFSLLVAHTTGTLVVNGVIWFSSRRLQLLPRGGPVRFDGTVFRWLLSFGKDILFLSMGLQLMNASQVVIISRILGLEAAAVWVVAVKAIGMAQQLVWRVWDFSAATLAEMIVRHERDLLRRRFYEVFVVTASLSVFLGGMVAVCNESLLAVWTSRKIGWNPINDLGMAVLLLTNSLARIHIGLTGQTMRIGAMRYIFFLEGLAFVVIAALVAGHWGIPGIIASAVLMSICWSGSYGVLRTASELGVPRWQVAFGWLKPPFLLALALVPLGFGCWWWTREMTPMLRLLTSVAVMLLSGGPLVWFLGLPLALRNDLVQLIRVRLHPAQATSVGS